MRNDLPAQPALEQYRDAIAWLELDGVHVAYLATKVERVRAGLLLRRQERLWLLLTRLDGTCEPIQEDYAPWSYVRELQEGFITWPWPEGGARYRVRWLAGAERRGAWARYGITQDVGAYMGTGR